MRPRFPNSESLRGSLGNSMYELIEELYPLARSITGNGVRDTFSRLSKLIDLRIQEVRTGSKVFDWTVPKEWNVRDAYIKDSSGNRVVDYRMSNLHLVQYSIPIQKTLRLDALKGHLHTIPEHPDWIPYRTSYYNENWGFCLQHRVLEELAEGDYEVCIDATLEPGSLSYAESIVEGRQSDTVLIFTHICHPSLCNDNLSGIGLATYLAKELANHDLRYTYRFVFAPATIGSIAWLSKNEHELAKIRCGLVLSVVGDAGRMVYKRSRRGATEIDLAVEHVFKSTLEDGELRDFSPWGYDERQFCSPGIDLAVGRLTRTPNGEYPEYHTSADDLSLVKPEYLMHSLQTLWDVVQVLEGNNKFINTEPKGEPQLGRRGLYRAIGGYQDVSLSQLAMLWVLNQSDGNNSLLDIARRSELSFDLIQRAADELLDAGLLREAR